MLKIKKLLKVAKYIAISYTCTAIITKSNPKQAIDLTIAHTNLIKICQIFSLKCPETKEVHKGS